MPASASDNPSPSDAPSAEPPITSKPEIITRFNSVISAIGYSEEQQVLIQKNFTFAKKIQTIVSLQKTPERRQNIVFYTSQLRGRDSLMCLMFLRYSLEPRNRGDEPGPDERGLFRCFLEHHGVGVLQRALGSSNREYLNAVLQLIVFLRRMYSLQAELLRRVLERSSLLEAGLLHRFINMTDETDPLLEEVPGMAGGTARCECAGGRACLCGSFLKGVVDGVFAMQNVRGELEFIFRLAEKRRERLAGLTRLMGREMLRDAREKFADKQLWERLYQLTVELEGAAAEEEKRCLRRTEESSLASRQTRGSREEDGSDLVDALKKVAQLEQQIAELARENGRLREEAKRAAQKGVPKASTEEEGASGASKATGSPTSSGAACCEAVAPIEKASEPTSDRKAVQKPPVSAPAQAAKAASKSTTAARLARFGALKTGAEAVKKETRKSIFSERSYEGLRWDKVTKSKDSIFESIDHFNFEGLFLFDDFKSFEVSKSPKKPLPRSSSKADHRTDQPPCLDFKKSYALNIALGRVKLSNQELLDRILSGALENENLATQFIIYFPTPEEFSSIRSCQEPLGRAERFFSECSDERALYSALYLIKFAAQLRTRDYVATFGALKALYTRILRSQELVRLFGTLLVIGNTLNINMLSGGATAFSLSSLDQFRSSEKLLRLVSSKTSKERLLGELGLEATSLSIEAVAQEIKDLKAFYNEEHLEEGVCAQFQEVLRLFNETMDLHRRTRGYLVDSDDSFVSRLKSFIDSL